MVMVGVVFVVVLAAVMGPVSAQSDAGLEEFKPVAREGNALFEQTLGEEAEHLDDLLQNHPDLEDIHFPNKYNIPVDFYREEDPIGYIMSVIFDPCRGHDFNCCNDTYGTPEFRSVIDAPGSDLHGTDEHREQDGTPLSTTDVDAHDHIVYTVTVSAVSASPTYSVAYNVDVIDGLLPSGEYLMERVDVDGVLAWQSGGAYDDGSDGHLVGGVFANVSAMAPGDVVDPGYEPLRYRDLLPR